MYLRTTTRKNKDGSTVQYVQLAHNERDPETGVPKAKVVYSFGRADQVDVQALRRLVQSICRFLDPEDVARAQAQMDGHKPLSIVSCRPLGGAWVLNALWEKLGIRETLERLLGSRNFQAPVERAIFAMVANRALAPKSKLAVEDWVRSDVVIDGLTEIPVHQLYRAMDFLLETGEELQKQVFCSVADLLNLEVDLIYFDTTSTYFETEMGGEDADDEDQGLLRRRGHSKDHRPDLPQAVIGLAVTREGIPVRCWVWPGNTADMSVIKEVKKDLIGWRLGRVITVTDRGFASEENLRELQRAGGHYITGERMRSGKPVVEEAMSRTGRYREVTGNMHVKEIVVGDGAKQVRYILVRNPKEAERQKAHRDEVLKKLEFELSEIKSLPKGEHTKAICALVSHPTYSKYLRNTKSGLPKIDRAKVKEEERFDGKYLIRTSDDTLPAEDVAYGYKQLLEVERAFRTLKSELELRPVYHRLDDRIRAHVPLCWLALLLVRVIETKTGATWNKLRQSLERMALVELVTPDGRILQRTASTQEQSRVFAALGLKEPPLVWGVQTS